MELSSIIISLIGLTVSIVAFIYAKKATDKASSMETSDRLMRIHEDIKTGRKVMRDIYDSWLEYSKLKLTPESLLGSENSKAKYSAINYYNMNYHDLPGNSKNRMLSDSIHTYFRHLNHLWTRVERKEFKKSEVAERFQKDITMDEALLKIYLEAHWIAHGEFKNTEDKRFWSNVPKLIDAIKTWE